MNGEFHNNILEKDLRSSYPYTLLRNGFSFCRKLFSLSCRKNRARSLQSRNRFVIFFNFLISCFVIFVFCGLGAVYFSIRAFNAPGPSVASQNFFIKPNTGVLTIANQLDRAGLIEDEWIFRLGLRLHGNEPFLKAGEYEIPAFSSMKDIMEILKSGKSIMRSITIPEGMTVEQAMQRIALAPELSGSMPENIPFEGMILTDTQHFMRDTTRREIIEKMQADQEELIKKIWEKRSPDLPITSIKEFVILASIVEKETSIPSERSRIAAVFMNRLKKKMRLQSDPTILYGLFGGKGKPTNRPIFKSDLEKETPYNTYLITGLPPTPIANPGKESLQAVANPIKTDELYFVADGQGGHVFSKTLIEHNKHVVRWRTIKKSNQEASSPSKEEQKIQKIETKKE